MLQEPEDAAPRPELPMRLTRLRVKNFRSIADIDIPLSPLTVLVGPNGSGKSNVVDALRFVRDVFARGLDQAVMDREGMGVIQRWGTEGEGITIEIEATISNTADDYSTAGEDKLIPKIKACVINYQFTFFESFLKEIIVKKEAIKLLFYTKDYQDIFIEKNFGDILINLSKSNKKEAVNKQQKVDKNTGYSLLLPSTLLSLSGITSVSAFLNNIGNVKKNIITFNQAIESESIFKKVTDFLEEQLFYTLNPTDLRQPQQVLKEYPFEEKGRNLAAVLRRLHREESAWKDLENTLRQAITGFDTLRIEAVGGYLATKVIYRNNEDQPRTSYLGQESDGTIRMLGLLAALYQDPAQPFLSIEEPEANIHPGALAVLASVLDEASLRSQILVTTHSPDMLDHLPAESFLVVEKVGDTTHVGPLDAGQLASVRKRLFTPGELLRMEGLQRQTTPNSAA